MSCPYCSAEDNTDPGSLSSFTCGTHYGGRSSKCYEIELARLHQFKAKAISLATLIKNYPTYHANELLYTVEDIQKKAADLIAERERYGKV